MCGIIGCYTSKKVAIDKGLESIKHRGPDGSGVVREIKNNRHLELGHVRLSIIDVDERSNQPFISKCGNYVLTFNGEIYNYKHLQEQMSSEIEFQTNSDTEVLLYHLIENGINGVKSLEGMFAFVFYDKIKGKLYFGRDQLGIKPLYVYEEENVFVWCSEIKGIRAMLDKPLEIDINAFREFIELGFMLEPNTGFKEVRKIMPGHFGVLDLESRSFDLFRYWRPGEPDKGVDVEVLVRQSIKSHLISDVPLGLFYSGGIDSTLILSELKNRQLKPIIVKANQEHVAESGHTSDFDYGQKIANQFGVDLDIIEPNKEEGLLESILNVVKLNEELLADYTSSVSELISKASRLKGYKVMLSGMGADEVFGGYSRYVLLKYSKWAKHLIPLIIPFIAWLPFFQKKIERFRSFYSNRNSRLNSYISLLSPFSVKEKSMLLLEGFKGEGFEKRVNDLWNTNRQSSMLKTAMAFDIFGFLSHNFLIADKSSMAASIELRVPLATQILFDKTMSMHDSELIKKGVTKLPLRKMLYEFLPKGLINRKKAGFHPPLDSEIRNLGSKKIMEVMSNSGIFEVLNRKVTESIIAEHFDGRANNTLKIYRLLFLSIWYDENKK